ncbi:MAG: YHS domain-containing protein [SAR202 cluster bacterium]|nr:YHS domain-containing protein [SAR202 cluster bacterium]
MAKAIDPICKMEVDTDNPRGGKSDYQGTTYYFCAHGCKRSFDQDSQKYLSGQGQPTPMKVSFFSKIMGKKS